MKDRLAESLTGALGLCRENLGYTPRKAIMTATSNPAWAFHHRIGDTHTAWFVEVNVSTSMLVRLRTRRPGHLAWLGGDLNFTARTITRPAGAHRRERPRNGGGETGNFKGIIDLIENEAGSLVDFIDSKSRGRLHGLEIEGRCKQARR